MKNLIAVLTLLLFAVVTVSAQTVEGNVSDFRKHFSVKMTGGLADLGKGDWRKYDWSVPDGKLDGEKLNWGWDGGVELRYHFHPEFSLALGVDRFWGKMDYADDMFTDNPDPEATDRMIYSDRGWIESGALPLMLTLYGNSRGYPLRTYAGVGVGYYFSSVSWYSNTYTLGIDSGPGTDLYKHALMKSGSVGYHWVLGWKYFFTRGIALAAEFNGRHAKVSGFKGTEKRVQLYQQPERVPAELLFQEVVYETETGELRAGQLSPNPDVVWQSDEDFHHSSVKSRKATMDFSGLSFKLGMAYHF
jgi:hypothetical protein